MNQQYTIFNPGKVTQAFTLSSLLVHLSRAFVIANLTSDDRSAPVKPGVA